MSITLYSSVIIVVDVKMAVHTHLWTWCNLIALLIFSILIYYGYVVLSQFIGTEVEYTSLTLMKYPNYWLIIVLVSLVVWAVDQATNSYHKFKDLSLKSAIRKYHIHFLNLLNKYDIIDPKKLKDIVIDMNKNGQQFQLG